MTCSLCDTYSNSKDFNDIFKIRHPSVVLFCEDNKLCDECIKKINNIWDSMTLIEKLDEIRILLEIVYEFEKRVMLIRLHKKLLKEINQ